jgi:hypothetical protein
MIAKHIFSILALLSSYFTNAQNIKKVDCVLLNKAVEAEIFRKQFYICSAQEVISIIDTSMYFKECELPEVCSRSFSLGNKFNNSMVSKTAIVIYRIDNIKHIYSLYFYRPHTGASLNLKFRYKRNKVKLLSYKVGAF